MTTTTAVGEAVARAFEALPDSHRKALALSRAGMTFLQVADALEMPVERVRVTVLHSVLALTQARLAATL
jgi:DNA-directed RNA polymerase specialized sigma24 family protein